MKKTSFICLLLSVTVWGQVLSQQNTPGGPLGQSNNIQTGWNGSFSGSINGTASILTLKISKSALEGTIDAGGYMYTLEGQVSGSQSDGKISDSKTGGAMDFKASLSGNVITLNLIVPGQVGQTSQLQLVFNRMEGGSQMQNQPPRGTPGSTAQHVERDQRIIGGWRHTTSYTSGDFSAVSEWYMQINADGTYRYGDGQMLGGNSDVSFDSGQGSASSGKWKTSNGIVYIDNGYGWQPYAAYTVDGYSMLFKFNDGSKQLWEKFR
jgi:hypothetical protein